MRDRGKRKWLGVAVSVLGLMLATLCFVFADGDGTVIVIGVLAAASVLLRLATSFLNRKPRSPSDDMDETAR